jgi:antitoxin VapB
MKGRTGPNPAEERRRMAKRTKRRQLSEKSARYIPSGIDQPDGSMQTAKLFKNGRSQAVRLPKEFRFEGDEVYVRRDGRSVVLTPKDQQPKAEQWKGFFAALDMFDPRFPLERHQPAQQKRKFLDDMFEPRPRRPKAKRK